MTNLEFVSATIGQLAWPVFVLIAVFLLREQIRQVVESPRLRRLKAGPGGVDIEFQAGVEEAKKDLEQAGTPDLPQSIDPAPETSDFYLDMLQLAPLSPRAVVLETHLRLEGVLRDALADELPDLGQGVQLGMRSLARRAQNRGMLNAQESSVLDELTLLRNRVAHEPDHAISEGNALEYVELATQLAIAIKLANGGTAADGPSL